MKKIRENTLLLIKTAAVVGFFLFCIIRTEAVRDAVYNAVMRCLNVIIPSLYAMMIISAILVRSRLTEKIGGIISKIGNLLFGMNGNVFSIFLLSMFAGYPIGTTMLCSEADKGTITRREAEIFSGICYGAGPAFIFGCISSRLYSSTTAGKIILLSATSANILLAFIISFAMRSKITKGNTLQKVNLSSDIVTESIISAGRSMANICFMITAFSVITAFIFQTGISSNISGVLSEKVGIPEHFSEGLIFAFLDITNINTLPSGDYNLLPALSALISFGGICVILQISVLISGKISIKPLILLRTAAAVLSYIICKMIAPHMLTNETVPTSNINYNMINSESPVSSFLLIIMTIILFGQYENIINRKNNQ